MAKEREKQMRARHGMSPLLTERKMKNVSDLQTHTHTNTNIESEEEEEEKNHGAISGIGAYSFLKSWPKLKKKMERANGGCSISVKIENDGKGEIRSQPVNVWMKVIFTCVK